MKPDIDSQQPSAGPASFEHACSGRTCAECASAQLYAVQPRALCTEPKSAFHGSVLFAGQPACAEMTVRESDDLSLSWPWPHRSAALKIVARGEAAGTSDVVARRGTQAMGGSELADVTAGA